MITKTMRAENVEKLPIKRIDMTKYEYVHGTAMCYMQGAGTITYNSLEKAQHDLGMSIVNRNNSEWLFMTEDTHYFVRVGVPKADAENDDDTDDESRYGNIVHPTFKKRVSSLMRSLIV